MPKVMSLFVLNSPHVNSLSEQSAEYENAMSSEYCAHHIERAITCGRKEVLLAPLLHRIVVYLRTLCPPIYYTVMKMRAAAERKAAAKHK